MGNLDYSMDGDPKPVGWGESLGIPALDSCRAQRNTDSYIDGKGTEL